MRLLEYLPGNDGFKVTLFSDDLPPPRYAILSHTWTKDQEVTYNELLAGTGRDKYGYAKMRFCGKRAAADGLRYFWVDTCCIDKATSEELNTAINSMFRWYQRADKCYVYLKDVSVPEEILNAEDFPISWKQAFLQSKWFTRGWTLQELLAPASVEFFSQEGKRLGNRISLEREIQDITGIPIVALRGQRLTEFSVDVRMSWAVRRTTTIKEDKTYCLFGIFGVFLPLIYGEGEEHAMSRLRDEIKKQQERQAVTDQEDLLSSSLLPFMPNEHSFGGQRAQPSEEHNLEAALADLAREQRPGLQWQHSAADLLELFGLYSDESFRKWIAKQLDVDVRAGPIGDPMQNRALHKAIINDLAPTEVEWIELQEARFQDKRCLNCGGGDHWMSICKANCGRYNNHRAPKCRYPVRCVECKQIGHMAKDCQRWS